MLETLLVCSKANRHHLTSSYLAVESKIKYFSSFFSLKYPVAELITRYKGFNCEYVYNHQFFLIMMYPA